MELSGKKGKGIFTKVDDDIFDKYGHLKWHLSSTGYAVRRHGGITIRLHRLVANTPQTKYTDHKNHDRLDNRASNLRVVTHRENMSNQKGEKGYTWDLSKGKWMVRYRGKFYGRYETEDEARKAYQKAKSGVAYDKTRRKLWHLPTGVTKQFGRYIVRPQKNGKRYWLGRFATLEEAQNKLKEWQERG